uniref:Uncharacterized protein n=1 Tax=Amphilophus citrinellus TaxID=61819 RepID=A0A3Q0S3A2_AMPCI
MMFRNNPGTIKTQFCHELETAGIPTSMKKTLIINHLLQASLKFTAAHMDEPNTFWRKVLWSFETKIELFDLNNKRSVWKSKDGGGSIRLWVFTVRVAGNQPILTNSINSTKKSGQISSQNDARSLLVATKSVWLKCKLVRDI